VINSQPNPDSTSSASTAASVLATRATVSPSEAAIELYRRALRQADYKDIDLLSRFGGTPDDPEEALRLYQQTTADGRLADMLSAVNYLQHLTMVQGHQIGAVGFCAGGGNCWQLALHTEALAAAVGQLAGGLEEQEAAGGLQQRRR
jgi:dienelactone hydrolase